MLPVVATVPFVRMQRACRTDGNVHDSRGDCDQPAGDAHAIKRIERQNTRQVTPCSACTTLQPSFHSVTAE
jgi:hypothetical protein